MSANYEKFCVLIKMILIAVKHYIFGTHDQTNIYGVSFLQQVLAFFSYLIKSLGDNIEFVVKPTLHDGMLVGISWKLGMRYTSFWS
jgi:hypothetical protein